MTKLGIVLACAIAVPGLARADSQEAGNCQQWLDRSVSLVDKLEHVDLDAQASDVAEVGTDIQSAIEQAALCIGKLPAGTERTRLSQHFDQLKGTLRARIRTAATAFTEARALRDEAAVLGRKLADHTTGAALDAEVDAFETKLGAATNRYITPAWRKAQISELHELLATRRAAARETEAAAEVARLAKNTVVARSAGKLTADDAARPAKVIEAFQAATKADLVASRVEAGRYMPDPADTSSTDPGTQANPPAIPDDDLGVYASSNHNGVGLWLKAPRPGLAPGVPALVWDVGPDRGTLVVVTMDGGRYVVEGDALREGLPAETSWPAQPLLANALVDRELVALAKLGVGSKQSDVAATAKHAYETCTDAIWKRHQPEYDALDAAHIKASERQARHSELDSRAFREIDGACTKHERAYTAAVKTALHEYMKLRASTLESIRARLRSL